MLISAYVSKLSTAMARYPDHLSLLVARSLFFRDAKLGPDGGYGDRCVMVAARESLVSSSSSSVIAVARSSGPLRNETESKDAVDLIEPPLHGEVGTLSVSGMEILVHSAVETTLIGCLADVRDV